MDEQQKRKICPIRHAALTVATTAGNPVTWDSPYCIEAQCAWWHSPLGSCGLIAQGMIQWAQSVLESGKRRAAEEPYN